MRVLTEGRKDIAVLRLRGRLLGGPDTAETIGGAIRAACAQGQNNILLDLGRVEIVNSAGLGILLANHVKLRRRGGALKLLNVTKRVQNVLMITDLITVFESYRSEESALASFA